MPIGFWQSLFWGSCKCLRTFRVAIFMSNTRIGPKSSLQRLPSWMSALERPTTYKPEARTGCSNASLSVSLVEQARETKSITLSHNRSANFQRNPTLSFKSRFDKGNQGMEQDNPVRRDPIEGAG